MWLEMLNKFLQDSKYILKNLVASLTTEQRQWLGKQKKFYKTFYGWIRNSKNWYTVFNNCIMYQENLLLKKCFGIWRHNENGNSVSQLFSLSRNKSSEIQSSAWRIKFQIWRPCLLFKNNLLLLSCAASLKRFWDVESEI